jgi:predicted AlkP superfamily pyrophosphatase or phosphodiesterase
MTKKARLVTALAAISLGTQTHAEALAHPTLIVAISVDQFSADLFSEYRQTYISGLQRLANAVVFPSGFQSHAATDTCPGHSTILTGSHPARTGIITNEWVDYRVTRGKEGSHAVYCAEDESQPGTTSSPKDYVVSPIHLRVPTMGDRMKLANPRSRVVSVAGKDRAAVMMGGHMTDAIWFLDPKKEASYVTLADHDQTAPAIVGEVNKRVAQTLANPVTPPLPASCRTKSVALQIGKDGPTIGQLADPTGLFKTTPQFDRATADIAIGLLRSMHLGRGPAPDLLAIGLSANDYVGHAFGTAGAEMCVQQVALDQTIGRILDALDRSGVNYVVMLTADHGGYDVPERTALRGIPDAGRLDTNFNLERIGGDLVREFGLQLDGKTLLDGAPQGDVYLSPAIPSQLRPQVLAAAKAKMEAFPQVAAVLSADEVEAVASPNWPVDDWTLGQKSRASFDRSRSGDLVVLLRPHVIPFQPCKGYTATHGSPWNYDRRVPVLFAFRGMTPHEEPLSIDTVDILPTLAAFIGLAVPKDEIDGRCIDLEPGSTSSCP